MNSANKRVKLTVYAPLCYVPSATYPKRYAVKKLKANIQTAYLILLVGPFLIMTTFMLISHYYLNNGERFLVYAALGLAVFVGLFGVRQLPTSDKTKNIVSLIYAPLLAAAIFFYTIVFACFAFGDCL